MTLGMLIWAGLSIWATVLLGALGGWYAAWVSWRKCEACYMHDEFSIESRTALITAITRLHGTNPEQDQDVLLANALVKVYMLIPPKPRSNK